MKTHYPSSFFAVAALFFGAALATPLQAQLIHNLDRSDTATGTSVSPWNVAVTNLIGDPDPAQASVTDTGGVAAVVNLSGSLSDQWVSQSNSYSMTVVGYSNSTFNSATSVVTLDSGDISTMGARQSYGWFPTGNSRHDPGQASVYTFDLSGLPTGTHLLLTEAVGRIWDASPLSEMQVIVNGVGHTTVTATDTSRGDRLTASGLNLKISDGDQLIFRGTSGSGGFITDSFTLVAVPEPSSAALLLGSLSLLVLFLRRRRRIA